MKSLVPIIVAAGVLVGPPAAAQRRSAAEAAKAFTLGSGTSATDVAPPSSVPAATPSGDQARSTAGPAADAPIVTTLGPPPSLDTPIEQLIANPRTKAVLDKDLPGLSTDENLVHFRTLSLRRFQPLTGGQLTTALLDKVGADLAALDEKAQTIIVPSSKATKHRRPSDSNQGR